MAEDVSWRTKAGIGAAGGIALVLLKLIEAKFYIDDITSKVAIAAYLTYAAYIVLGVLVAVFLSESDVPPVKVKRSAFVTGLLAPTMLIAIATQPPATHKISEDPLRRLQHISLFISSAHAEEPKNPRTDESTQGRTGSEDGKGVTLLRKQDLDMKFADAVWLALGRERPVKSYLYVIGYSEEYKKAADAALKVNSASKKFTWPATLPAAKVVKFEGSQLYFVTVGDAKSFEEASSWKTSASSTAINIVTREPSNYTKDVARLLLDGQVVDGRQLVLNEKIVK